MTTSLKRAGTVLLSVLLLCTLALSAGAASKLRVGVKFWKTGSDKESMANSGIDTSREASLTRQSNGTYTLTLPIQQVSKMGVTGYLTGLTIGDVTYTGTLTGEMLPDFHKQRYNGCRHPDFHYSPVETNGHKPTACPLLSENMPQNL